MLNSKSLIFIKFTVFIVLLQYCKGQEIAAENNKRTNMVEITGQEQGRTLVHHAVKRWMVILPAVFFKLGIAFTLLVAVTLVSVGNGLVGFLLLVVGLSSVLARLQPSQPTTLVPTTYTVPHHLHHQPHFSPVLLDRSDHHQADSASLNEEYQQTNSNSYRGKINTLPYSSWNTIYKA